MRLLKKLQLFLTPAKVACDRSQELEEMGRILEEVKGLSGVYQQILRDINGEKKRTTGREGVTAEQVLKLGLLRKRHGLTYREMATATQDSLSMRRFLNLPPEKGLSRSAIQNNLKKVKDTTWEQANTCLLKYAREQKIETGQVVRGDTTTVETNIHYPTDASLLNDVVRVLSRNLADARQIIGKRADYTDHRRRAKGKLYRINNAHGEEKRRPMYLELIRVTRETVADAARLLPVIEKYPCSDLMDGLKLDAVVTELKTHIPRGKTVIDQAYRRVVKREDVPASEKIVSIFEEHTDIIVKGFRDVVFGHKVMLTTGVSGLLLTLRVLDGNPKDSTLVPATLSKLIELNGKAPGAAAFDGCFASRENRDVAKAAGVDELTFSKNGSLDLTSLVSSTVMHKALVKFRAGVEGCISFLKRIFGWSRVFDRGKETFASALHLAGLAYNLTLLARINLARPTCG